MTEQEYKQTLNLIENSVFANMPLQWVETFQPGIGQMIANIEREVTEWADLNAPVWAVDPLQSGTYNAVKSELLAFAQNLQKYKDDPARSEVIYDFINAARSLYSFNKNYGLDRTPLTNAENPFKLSIVSSRVAAFGYMHFKNLANLVKFNEDLLSSIDDEKIQLKEYTKAVLEPVREKLYKLITEDPEFKTLLEELGYGEADDFIQSFAPGNSVLESLTDEFFSNFNTFVGNISARLDTERQTTDLAIADARADAQESIDVALARVDKLVSDLSTYQTGINTQIQTIESAYESLNTTVQSNISRIDATEAAIIQEATTRADGFVATAARIDGMVSRIDAVDASILQEANTRASEDAATADRIDQLVTRVDDNAAAIINEQNARTTALLAEATARETLAAQLKSDSELYASGLVTSEANVRAAQDQVLGERIDLVSAEVGGISTAILDEQTARITGDEAEATSRKALSTKLFGTDVIDGVTVDTLTSGFLYDQQQSIITQTESVVTAATGQIAQIQTDLTNTKADLLTETTTRVNEYGAIATSVTVLSTEVNNQKATLDSLNSIVSGPDGITTQWGIKSDINGYITGVGLISSSKYGTPTSQFIVYADQFALVTPGVNGGQPTLPFFVGSEQGYLELSNTIKNNWNNVIGDGKPQDGATRNVFRGDWTTSTSYVVGDIVLKDGNGWSCILVHTSSSSNQPPASGSGNTWWKLYAVKGSDGAQGLHALTVLVPNNAHTLPAASDGAVSSYTGSGTTIQVFEGTTALSAVSSITANGQFTIGTPTQVPTSTITVGARSYAGTTATVAQHSAMVAGTDLVVVTYPITVRRTDGTTVTLSATQTLTKSKAGATGSTGAQGPAGPAVVVTANRALTFTSTGGTLDGSQANIVLTATVSGIASPTYAWTFSGLQTNPTASTTNSQTITAAQFGTAKSATVTCTVNGVHVDQVTIVRLDQSTEIGGSGVNHCNPRYVVFNEGALPPVIVGNGTATLDTAVGYFGTKSLCLTATANDNYCYLSASTAQNNITLQPNTKWILSGYVRCNQASKQGQAYIRRGPNLHSGISFTTSATANTWTRFSGVINLSSASETSAIMRLDNDGGAGCVMWYDGLMLEPLIGTNTAPSPFVAPPNFLELYTGDLNATAGANWATNIAGKPADSALLNNQDGVIRAPGGGTYRTTTASVTGACKIALPVFFTNTMLTIDVDIFEYSTGLSCSLQISGYNYSANTTWHQVTARVIGNSNVEYPVYFGHDGTKACIWVGLPGEVWAYPQVTITGVRLGYSNISRAMWENGWAISFDQTAITSGTGANQYSASVLDTLPGANWNKITGTNKPANNATRNNIYRQSTTPSGAANGDIWIDTSVTPNVQKMLVAGTWQLASTVGATFNTGQAGTITGRITPSNVTTYIADAAIGNAQIGGDIWSSDHVAGSAGWRIYRSGNAEFRNITARGDIEASSLKANAAMVNRANIVDAAVDTLQIAGNAVTIPVAASGTSRCQTPSVNFNSAVLNIILAGNSGLTSDSTSSTSGAVWLDLYRNAGRIGSWLVVSHNTTTGTKGGSVTAVFQDNPGAGAFYYTAELRLSANNSFIASNQSVSVLVLGTRR